MSVVRSCNNRFPGFKGPWLLTYQGKTDLRQECHSLKCYRNGQRHNCPCDWMEPDSMLSWVLFLPCLPPCVLICWTISHPLSLLFLGLFHILNNNNAHVSCFNDRLPGMGMEESGELNRKGHFIRRCFVIAFRLERVLCDSFQTGTNAFLLCG